MQRSDQNRNRLLQAPTATKTEVAKLPFNSVCRSGSVMLVCSKIFVCGWGLNVDNMSAAPLT
eukprot:3237814-Amphidinium_carterae.1